MISKQNCLLMVQIHLTRYVPKVHLAVCLDIIDMMNTGQGDDMKWNMMKNGPWPNSVIFVHEMLQSQIDIFTMMAVPALQRKQKEHGTEHFSACTQISRLWLQVCR